MAQLSLYLDDASMEDLRRSAQSRGVTLSKYVRDVLVDDAHGGWPNGFFDLYGALDDPSFVEPPEIPWELDTPRLGW